MNFKKALHVCEKGPMCMSKEACMYVKRALYAYVPQSSNLTARQRLQ